MKYGLFCLCLAAAPAMASAAGTAGDAPRHPVIREAVASVTMDCVVTAAGRGAFGVRDCVVVSASPAARGETDRIVRRFEAQAHVRLTGVKAGAHRRFTYSWRIDAA